jgi:hypothetical protein
MNSTRIINIVLVVVVVGAIAWGLSLVHVPQPAAPAMQHVLQGQLTASGNYHYNETADYYTIDADYPATTTLTGPADVKARLTIEQGLADQIAQFKQDGNFASLTPEDVQIQGLGPDRKYALDMTYQVYASPNYASYFYTIYEDTLGAHPNAYFKTFVFDAQGNQVSINDIIASNPNGLQELSLLVSNDVVSQLKTRLGVDDVTGDMYPEGVSPTADNFSNFVIDGDSLLIELPPYQVAAYAAGSFEVRIKLSDIQ